MALLVLPSMATPAFATPLALHPTLSSSTSFHAVTPTKPKPLLPLVSSRRRRPRHVPSPLSLPTPIVIVTSSSADGPADEDAPSDTYVPAAEATTSATTHQNTLSKRTALISRLLQLCAATNRGQDATTSQTTCLQEIVTSLEDINPTPDPVNTDMLDGLWTLVYTSKTLLQSSKTVDLLFKPLVQLAQVRQRIALNDSLLSTQADLILFPATTLTISSDTSLTPVGGDRLELSPAKTTVTGGKLLSALDMGGLSFDIPVQQLLSRLSDRFSALSADLYLDTYYVDDNLRISRSSKGHLFIYTRLD